MTTNIVTPRKPESRWSLVKSDINQKWEIYVLWMLSVTGVILHYLHIPETSNDVIGAVKTLQYTHTYLILMLCLLSIHFLKRSSRRQATPAESTNFKHIPLDEAIRISRDNRGLVNRVRILAATTANIEPMLMTPSDLKIQKCEILLPQKDQVIAGRTLNERVSTFINKWRDLKESGRISELSIKGYSFTPLLYLVIFDERMMILGLFKEDSTKHIPVQVGEPMVVSDATPDGAKLILRWADWFDHFNNRLPVHEYLT